MTFSKRMLMNLRKPDKTGIRGGNDASADQAKILHADAW